MAKAYSLDLRERVAARVVAGEPVRAAGAAFSVSASSAVRWSGRLRATGSAARAKAGGPRPRALDGQRDWLLQRLEADPSVALRALQAELAGRGVAVSYGTVWNFVHREKLSFKKKLSRPASRSGPT